MSSSLWRSTASVAVVAAALCLPSMAHAQTHRFDIAAQSASSGIRAFAQQAGIQVIATDRTTEGRTVNAVRGDLDVRVALDRLLAGTGLVVRSFDRNVAILDLGSSAAAEQSDIIVTGSARAQRRFDVSYTVSSLSQDDVKRLAPKSYADLLGSLPGIHVESTGGEVQNIMRLRGIPADRGNLVFQQDGLPLYNELDGQFFNSGEGMSRYDLMTERVEVVQGGPAPIYASNAAGIVNNITLTGTDASKGEAQLTIGDIGLYRLDAVQSGPLGKDTYYAVGGFLRYSDGYRPSGFANDRGGQIRANIKQGLDNGYIKVTGTYVNDHNVFYLPIPIADPNDPSKSLNPWINYFTGTMNSPAFRNVGIKYLDGAGVLQGIDADLANGRHLEYGNVGLQYQGDFDGWRVTVNAGYTKGRNVLDALYSTANPSDANAYAAGYLSAAQAAFGPDVTHLGYAFAGTDGASLYDPYSQSGLVMPAQYRHIISDFYSGQADLSVTKKLRTGFGTHDIKVGAYTSFYGQDYSLVYQDYLIQVAGQPKTLDLLAYSASGAILGSVTDKGVLHYASTLSAGATDAKDFSLYANDTWAITPELRLDAGIRHDWYDYKGYAALSTNANLGDAATLADDTTRRFTGALLNQTFRPEATNWTVGLNYDFSSHLGIYGRASHIENPQSSQVVMSTSPSFTTTKANLYEVGLKASYGRNYLYLTGFYTKYDPYGISFVTYDPSTGRNDQSVPFVGNVVAKGVAIDGNYSPVKWFTLNSAVTFADPQYSDLTNVNGADPLDINGNQFVREAKFYGHVMPRFNFASGNNQIEFYGIYNFVGKEYVDVYNNTELPAYQTVGAGVTLTHGNWRFQVVGDNLFNAHGLTEGNPRTDSLAGQGASVAIYGRPLFGRNFRFMLSKSW